MEDLRDHHVADARLILSGQPSKIQTRTSTLRISLSLFLPIAALGLLTPSRLSAGVGPGIATQPQSQNVIAGANAVFTVIASGQTPYTYQWLFDGTNLGDVGRISGATSATLTVSNAAVSDSGNYGVLVGNSHGSVMSSNAVLAVGFAPAITGQPPSQIRIIGGTAMFGAKLSGSTPLTFRWSLNTIPLTDNARTLGTGTPSLTISNLQSGDSGAYTLTATNLFGTVTSVPANLTVLTNAAGSVRYVNWNNPNPEPPYNNWSNAAANIQDAIDAANPGEEILVTNGVYSVGNRVVSGITNRVAMTMPVLLASVNGPGWTRIDGGGSARCINMVDGGSLSGFTLTNGVTPENGGGARCDTTNVVITDCVFTGNSAAVQGGGAYQGTLVNCTLDGNSAAGNAAGYPGGGGASSSVLSQCLVSGNASTGYGTGAGLFNCFASQCVIISNSAPQTMAGGASYCTLDNCLLANNYAGSKGGGADSSTLNNCTVVQNTANLGAGGGISASTANNCIIYYNQFLQALNFGATPDQTNCAGSTVNYSCTMPSPTNGVGNITNAPVFANQSAGDFHFYPGSPGIDSGDNAHAAGLFDLDGHQRIVNGTVDMGAYEFQNTPFIEAQPVGQTVPMGEPSVSFGVVVVGPGLGYQWMFNGSRLDGATSATLTLTDVQFSQAGLYSLVVTNTFGSATSSNALLMVVPPTPPSFVFQPAGQTVLVGTNVTLTASATGAPPPGYQWFFNGTALADNSHYLGSASDTLQISNVQTNDTGAYFVVATNTGGAVTSAVASVAVLQPPAIVVEPASQTVTQGLAVTFTAAASGSQPLSYQWYFKGNPLADGGQVIGSASTALTVSDCQLSNAGNYVLVVTNPVGTAASTAAVLTLAAPPIILQQPVNQTARWGAAAEFNVLATGTPQPFSYQWSFNGTNLDGATNSVLTLTNVQPGQAGNYAVQINNAVGFVLSSNAILTVDVPSPGVPFITGLSLNAANAGASITLFGTNFSPVPGSNIVHFGAVRANVVSASLTNLVVTIPAGATFGPVTETVAGLTAYSKDFFEPTFPGNGANVTTGSFATGFNLGTAVNPGSAVIADLDGDGRPDIAVVSGGGHVVSIFRNISANGSLLSSASFAPRVDLPFPTLGTGGNPYRLRAVDLDGDGRLDLIAEEVSGSRITIFHNISTSGNLVGPAFEPAFILATGKDCRFAASADLDGDGRPDIVALNYGDKTISIFQNVGASGLLTSNSFAAPVVLAAPGGPYEVVIADLDGDGKPDLAVANTDNHTVSIYQNFATMGAIATNSFGARVDLPGDSSPETIVAVDLDGDGRLDLVVGAVQSETVSVYQNMSSSGVLTSNSFGTRVGFATGYWTHTVAVGDFNGDGKPDITVVGELPSVMSIFENASAPGILNGSSFAPRVDFTTGWNAWGVAAGDLDGDGRPDIVFCNDYDNTLTIYQNQAAFGGPPVIQTQPGNVAVPIGSIAQFAATVIGQLPLSYSWYFNGTNLADNAHIIGSATGSLSISNVQLADAGTYYFITTNSLGSVTSAVANLTVLVPPVFTQQPLSQTTLVGSNITFTAAVTGTTPFGYQWYFNGALLTDNGHVSGSTTTNLTITGVQTSDLGNYMVVATNPAGSASSAIATLALSTPVITAQPRGQTVLGGSTVTLTITATGQQPLAYQWLFNGANLDSATNNPLVLTNVLVSQAGTYSVLVSNSFGTALSSNATLTVAPLAITAQPTNRVAWAGGAATFRVNVSGQPPFSFNWQCNGAAVPGPWTNVLTLTNLQPSQFGLYSVVVSNAYGTLTSSNAALIFSQVAVWGGFTGESNLTAGLTNVLEIAGVEMSQYPYDCLALVGSRTVVTWPENLSGAQLAGATNLIAIAGAGGGYGLRADGTVVQWTQYGARSMTGFSNVVAIAAFEYSLLALKANGTVIGGNSTVGGPSPVVGLSNVVAIAQGAVHSLALKRDGTITAWGSNTYGQTNVPAGLSNVVAVAAGEYHSLALSADGTVTGWGLNRSGQVTVPAGLSNVVAIGAGAFHSLALRANGTVVAWGLNSYGQTNVPSSLRNVIAIAAGANHSMALMGNGPPPGGLVLTNPSLGTNGFTLSLPSQSGRVYSEEYKNSLSDTNWTPFPLVPGNGGAVLLIDPRATNTQGFYRVGQW